MFAFNKHSDFFGLFIGEWIIFTHFCVGLNKPVNNCSTVLGSHVQKVMEKKSFDQQILINSVIRLYLRAKEWFSLKRRILKPECAGRNLCVFWLMEL